MADVTEKELFGGLQKIKIIALQRTVRKFIELLCNEISLKVGQREEESVFIVH